LPGKRDVNQVLITSIISRMLRRLVPFMGLVELANIEQYFAYYCAQPSTRPDQAHLMTRGLPFFEK
jgi:hypothetical protein